MAYAWLWVNTTIPPPQNTRSPVLLTPFPINNLFSVCNPAIWGYDEASKGVPAIFRGGCRYFVSVCLYVCVCVHGCWRMCVFVCAVVGVCVCMCVRLLAHVSAECRCTMWTDTRSCRECPSYHPYTHPQILHIWGSWDSPCTLVSRVSYTSSIDPPYVAVAGWKTSVSNANEPHKRDYILQKRPVIFHIMGHDMHHGCIHVVRTDARIHPVKSYTNASSVWRILVCTYDTVHQCIGGIRVSVVTTCLFSWHVCTQDITSVYSCGGHSRGAHSHYGVATVSRLLKITGLFCRILFLL